MLKSDNKRRTTAHGVSTAQAQRITSARQALERIRPFGRTVNRGDLALATHAHRCSELAKAARKIAVDNGLEASVVGHHAHEFAVIGRIPDWPLPRLLTDWPEDLAICDPWTNWPALPATIRPNP